MSFVHRIELTKKYGKDVADLAEMILVKLQEYVSMRKFSGVYCDSVSFHYNATTNIGGFYITFPKARPIALAGFDLTTGDYHYKSIHDLPIYKIDGIDMPKIISRAESEWSMAPQEKTRY